MANAETLAAVWTRLTQSWRSYIAALCPTDQSKAAFLSDIADLPDAELSETALREARTRQQLFPNDNLAAILRAGAETLVAEKARMAAKAKGERKHQIALEELQREKKLLGAAGLMVGLKPPTMSFRDSIRDVKFALDEEPDPLLRAQAMVGSMDHSMDERLRESILRLITRAKEKRQRRAGGQVMEP